MKKITIISCTIFAVLLSFNVFANIEKGKWNFVKDDDFCFIGSYPTSVEIPEGKKRGEAIILVYRMNKDPKKIIQINAGYDYKEGDDVIVKIDKNIYNFYAVEDSAWTEDDKKIIQAMKKGVELTVTGISSRGTKTIDIYTLKGFTAAFNILSKDC